MKNIGGSILPSSSPKILTPIVCSFGTLQVKAQPELDTHSLFLGDTIIASHPNGFSCHALAERMQKGEWVRAMEQADYIVRCGGTADKEMVQKLVPNLR
jgi:hypothetical protein